MLRSFGFLDLKRFLSWLLKGRSLGLDVLGGGLAKSGSGLRARTSSRARHTGRADPSLVPKGVVAPRARAGSLAARDVPKGLNLGEDGGLTHTISGASSASVPEASSGLTVGREDAGEGG